MTALDRSEATFFEPGLLPGGVRSRFVENVNGMRMHVLEAGFETPDRPCLLLLHGFPELAFSWRKVMPDLAAAGYHVVAPDQRGYGRTTGWDPDYDGNLRSFRILNIVCDAIALVSALGLHSVAAVVGHDFGAFVAAYCALTRPDLFRAVALMSAPFDGPPAFPFATDGEADTSGTAPQDDIHKALAALRPPRKHYQWYYGDRSADDNMRRAPQGVAAFLRAYFHVKSADWAGNQPVPLAAWTADELAKLPTYYVMDLHRGMSDTVARFMPQRAENSGGRWLPDSDLRIYAQEFARTGFQGGLQWYRCMTDPEIASELRLFSGRTIDVPSCFIAGAQDWGIHQKPGAFEAMQDRACTRMLSCDLVDGAGHWVQQEQPERVVELLRKFCAQA